MTAEPLVLHLLGDAHGLATAVAQSLATHAAAAPPGPFAELLERRADAVRLGGERIEERLDALGDERRGRRQAYAAAQTALGQLAAASRGPIDRLLGAGAAMRVLRHAREDVAAAAYEAATYQALEAIAEAAGDEATAALAREHRQEAERFAAALGVLIPELARDTLGSPPSDAVRAATERAQEAVAAVLESVPRAGAPQVPAPAEADADGLPIRGYAGLRAGEVIPRLDGLSPDELEAVERYERTHRCRRRVLDEIRRLREGRPS